MSILVTTNEPIKVRNLFKDKIELPMNYDFRLYTDQGVVGIERKAVPGDLLASVGDGRLRNEIIAMREECDFQVILLHGIIRYSRDQRVLFGPKRKSRWTKKGVRNFIRTLEWVERCYVECVDNDTELVEMVYDLQEYLDKGRHLSLKGRPGIQTDWLRTTKDEHIAHFYDGIPGIAPIRAKNLAEKFPNPIDLYQATVDDISTVNGLGKPTAKKIYNFLRGQ